MMSRPTVGENFAANWRAYADGLGEILEAEGAHLAKLEAENAQANKDNTKVWARNAELKAKFDALEAELQKFRAENIELEATIAELEAELEWYETKFTPPLQRPPTGEQ